jgi:hypothetical protein
MGIAANPRLVDPTESDAFQKYEVERRKCREVNMDFTILSQPLHIWAVS